MSLVKVGTKNQVVIPKSVRAQLGVKPGDYVEISFNQNKALIRHKPEAVRYTDEPIGPKTRAAIRQGLKEIKEGKTYEPFDNIQDLLADLHRRSRPAKRKT